MATVRDVTYDLLRQLGMTYVFGNPGSTEEPFLTRFPGDLTYVLGLHESVVVAMADGFAQASGNAAFINLHTAPGVGNGMGALVTAWHSKTPLVVTAGQQTRQMMAMEPWLINREATELPRPYVKWSHEPVRAEDVPSAIERAYHIAMAPPRGPVFVSIPMDDWDVEAVPRKARTVDSRSAPDSEALEKFAAALSVAEHPAIVVGGGVDRADAWDDAVRLAERLGAEVWEAPAPERASFPQDHPLFQGFLPLSIAPLADGLRGYDLVLVVGAPVFRYYPYIPGPVLHQGTRLLHITDDPDEAARAPLGDAVVGDVRAALVRLGERTAKGSRSKPPRRPDPAATAPEQPMSVAFAFHELARTLPAETVVVEESASSRGPFYDQVRINRPCSYFATASGGLGFALPAAVGAGLARPGTPVVCIAGDGSTMFGIHAIWTAAEYKIPVVFVVINNGHYGILKSFAAFQQTPGVPGLDLPGLDFVSLARGLGAEARRVSDPDVLADAYREAFTAAMMDSRPILLDIVVHSGVQALFGEPRPVERRP
ncbi:MAG: benzoylformate decarboxylase [Thermomicrobiales bacterium]